MGAVATLIYPDRREEQTLRREQQATRRSLLPPLELDDVFAFYKVDEEQVLQVLGFLRRHPRLIPVLVAAVPHLERIFPGEPVHLELEEDPEEGTRELFAVIRTSLDPEKALEALQEFDEAWFKRVARRAGTLVNFTVDVP